jgi:hypothetical protein
MRALISAPTSVSRSSGSPMRSFFVAATKRSTKLS